MKSAYPLLDHTTAGYATRAISIDGGGFLGLATAQLLAGLEHHHSVRLREHFHLFAGSSTGAIIALGLAYGLTASEIVGLYESMGPKVFRARPVYQWLHKAKYAIEPLREALNATFGNTTLGDLHDQGKGVLITAFNLHTGNPRVFRTDHDPSLTTDSRLKVAEIALASAAAPTYFPVVAVTNPATDTTENYCDGAVMTNSPSLLAYTELISTLKVAPAQVRLLSISTPREHLGEEPSKHVDQDRGLIAWALSLPHLLIGAGVHNAHESLRRITSSCIPPRPRYERILLSNPHSLKMDDASANAMHALKILGNQAASNPAVREQLMNIITP